MFCGFEHRLRRDYSVDLTTDLGWGGRGWEGILWIRPCHSPTATVSVSDTCFRSRYRVRGHTHAHCSSPHKSSTDTRKLSNYNKQTRLSLEVFVHIVTVGGNHTLDFNCLYQLALNFVCRWNRIFSINIFVTIYLETDAKKFSCQTETTTQSL